MFLLASDGLTGMIEDARLHEILRSSPDPQRLVETLVAEANRLGGLDNITAIVVRIDGIPAPSAKPAAAPGATA
jgi:protein phosphatase